MLLSLRGPDSTIVLLPVWLCSKLTLTPSLTERLSPELQRINLFYLCFWHQCRYFLQTGLRVHSLVLCLESLTKGTVSNSDIRPPQLHASIHPNLVIPSSSYGECPVSQ